MATYTTNYDLIKPDAQDYYNVDDFNENADRIDEELKRREDHESDTNNPHQVTAAQVGAAAEAHHHASWSDMPSQPLSIAQGGTGQASMTTNLLTVQYRGIGLSASAPSALSNGTIQGVYQ